MLGQSYAFTCNVYGGNVITYQWIKDDHFILNEVGATLSFQALGLSDSGLYTCIIIVNAISYNSSIGITLQCK